MISTVADRQKRHQLLLDAKTVLDRATQERRSLTVADHAEYDRLTLEASKLQTEIDAAEKRNDLDRQDRGQQLSQDDGNRNRQNDTVQNIVDATLDAAAGRAAMLASRGQADSLSLMRIKR